MKKRAIWRTVLVWAILAGGALAASAQGTVTRPPTQSTSSSQSGKTSGSQSGRTNAQSSQPTKKLYSYSEFVNSDFGQWVKKNNIFPQILTANKNGEILSENSFKLWTLQGFTNSQYVVTLKLIGVNASTDFINETVESLEALESFGFNKEKLSIAANLNEFSRFIPYDVSGMILFSSNVMDSGFPIVFKEGSSTLSETDKLELYILAQYVNSTNEGLILEGNTNRNVGDKSSQDKLCMIRAMAVYNFLTEHCDVNSERIKVEIAGEMLNWFSDEWNNSVFISISS